MMSAAFTQIYTRTLRTALNALRRNKMRAALTTLGIVIGVAAVIAMMEIGNGSSRAIQRSIATMGADNLLVMPGTAASGGVTFGRGSAMTLTPEDAEAILNECPAVRAVAPIVRSRTQIVRGNLNWVPLYIYGTTPAFLEVRQWDTSEGDFFTQRDVRNASKVAVIGQTLARELFGGESPVGQEIRMQNVSFRVVGVLSPKGANMMGFDQDDVVLAPWTTIKNRVSGSSLANTNQSASAQESGSMGGLYPGRPVAYPGMSAAQAANTPVTVRFVNVDQILVAARSSQQVQPAIAQITQLLRERHRLRPGQPDDFNVRDMTEITRQMTSITGLMTRLLLSVALISLVVGGVGIMNIMLVSVTERTREIGLRMAVGARGRDILRQFLVESVVLCGVGGAIGILLGRGSSLVLRTLFQWPTELSVGAIIAAVVVSVSVGVIFGYYPAWKASRLDPIEALRYE